MRTLLALLFVAAAAVRAQPVARSQIDMLPGVEQDQRSKLYRAYYGAQGRIDSASRRIRDIDAALRKRPKSDQRKQLTAERAKLREGLRKLFKQMFSGFRKAGLDEAQIKRMQNIPTGALREERYNHSVVLEAPKLSGEQRGLLTRMVASVDAAQRALHVQQRYLQSTLKQADPLLKRQFNSAFFNQKSRMERRFWRMVYYALHPYQMVAVRKLFSPRYRSIPQLEQQIYLLPLMSPSQAARIRALFREHESEITADRAAVRRLSREVRQKGLAKEQRDKMQGEIRACQGRMGRLNLGFRDAIIAVLTEKQRDALRARAPLLNTGDYNQGLRRQIGEMQPTGIQNLAIAQIRKEVQRQQRGSRRELDDATGKLRGADLGPDSPQAMTMRMMQRNMGARNLAFIRAAGRRVILEVLTRQQVTNWVVAPKVAP